jgi:hypothetical protein
VAGVNEQAEHDEDKHARDGDGADACRNDREGARRQASSATRCCVAQAGEARSGNGQTLALTSDKPLPGPSGVTTIRYGIHLGIVGLFVSARSCGK